ncbi:STAS domain-containing protein [Chachezhania antarctica]|uniref:STAS domain-containing protein n=1 Tax=Chachezhania antarctica TaxID=2340860 RepID=UPI000EAF637C|nr:STAS domain-containing protein [Chachezhania antarctica]
MSLTSRTMGDVSVVNVDVDRIDAAIAIQFKEDMRAATQDGAPRVILDLSKVDFIDSSGLGAIVAIRKQLGEERQLDLAGLTSTVKKVFQLTRMDTVFKIYPDAETAVSAAAA